MTTRTSRRRTLPPVSSLSPKRFRPNCAEKDQRLSDWFLGKRWGGCGGVGRRAREPQRRSQLQRNPHHYDSGHTRKGPPAETIRRPAPNCGSYSSGTEAVVERIEAGAIVEPGEEDRLREEAALADDLLQRLGPLDELLQARPVQRGL